MEYIVVSFGDVGKISYYENYIAKFDCYDDARKYAMGLTDVFIRTESLYNRISSDGMDFKTALEYYKDDISDDAGIENIYDLCDYLNSLEIYGCGNEFSVGCDDEYLN